LPRKVHESFEFIDRRALQDVSGEGSVFRHRATGAEVLAVRNADPEMIFGIAIETFPRHSNGVAHLLEHLVFRGSHRYPQTNLYAGLAQGTLLTGLNASTRADTTLFHLSGTHQADFSNLIDVLLDAVFHPLLRDEDILEEREVVKNEVAGHHALPHNRMLERLRQELLPGTIYAVDYGGIPKSVEKLKPEELRSFHAAHYRPACARLFLWGNIDLTARLDQLDRLLGSRPDRTVSHLDFPKTFPNSRHVKAMFAAPNESPFMTGFGWAFEVDNVDLWSAMALGLLAEPNGTLRVAMSELGGRVMGRGFSSDTPLGTFEIAVAGHPSEAGPLAVSKVRQTLDQLSRDGIGENWVLEAVDRLELQLRNFGHPSQLPHGLRALNMILGQWRHGADPLALLDISTRLAHLRQTIAADPATVVHLLTHDLVENPHKVVLSLEPQNEVSHAASRRTRTKPAPDPTERTAKLKLPFTKRDDLPSQVSRISVDVDKGVLHVPTVGPELARAELAISLSGLSAREIELVPIFATLLAAACTSENVEISTRCWTGAGHGKTDGAWLFLSGRSLPSRSGLLLDRMRETLLQKTPGADVIGRRIETDIAELKSQIASFGHVYCETRLRALGNNAGAWQERLNGLAGKAALNRLSAQDPEQVSAALTQLQKCLFVESRADLAVWGVAPSLANQFVAELCRTEKHCKRPHPLNLPTKEGIPTGAPNFTTGQALRLGATGAAHVVAHMLETGWLWDSVRVAGGAYSVRCRYDAGDGLLTLLSIRDPLPLLTLDRFREASVWLTHNASAGLLERCIAAKTGHLVRPVRPDDLLAVALQRHLCGETDVVRQSNLENVRNVSAASINQFSQRFEAGLPKARTVALGPQDGLHSALSERPGVFMMQPE
jgi:Zn-dependent M16 (insulinase) family peptidase